MKRYTRARLEAALGLVVKSYRFPRTGSFMNVTFAIDGDFDAGSETPGSR
jgi:hypothetical protein